nr:lipopolysaccharide assembly protein LapA domain-containing protein [Tranquillimonas alkanivorans]
MRYLRYAFLALLAICLITVALANRAPVTLRVLPADMAGFLGWSWELTLPLFLVIFLGILAGLLIGFVWEWFREHKHRAQARRERREKEKLAQEVTRLKTPAPGRQDDVLALLEDGSTPR